MQSFIKSIPYRIKNHWTPFRVFYLILGPIVVFQSGMHSDYLGMSMGIYLSAMGLFGLGCASGHCASGHCEVPNKK
jgi:hypothetical protein